ncbi:MAG: PorT family protein [Chitinophagaceae bacterium]|nr:PorT family protein [Chitinophagaceae bacterium]
MKLRLAVIVGLSLIYSIAMSQESEVYIKGGLNIANVTTNSSGAIENANALASFHVGVMGDLPLGKYLAVQPALLFTGKGAKTESGSSANPTYFTATSSPYYIELPVNLVLKLPLANEGSGLFVGAGPYIAMGVAGKNKSEGKIFGVPFESDKSIDFSNDDPTTGTEEGAGFGIMRRFDYGVNATAGLLLNNLLIGLNYGIGLAKLQSGADNSDDDNNKHRVFSLSLGFRL